MITWALSTLLLMFACSGWSLTTKRQQDVALEVILAELETHYGMAPFKEKTYGVTLDGLRKKYARLIKQARTLEEETGVIPQTTRDILPPEEFRQLMVGMIAELRDGHVNINRQTNQFSTLGLNAANIGEKLYVTEVRKDLMTAYSSMKSIEVNDEIVAINGVPIAELAKRNLLYAAGGTFADRWQTAMATTINTPHGNMRAKPDGEKALLTLRRVVDGKDEEFTASLRWLETSDYLFLTRLFPKNFPSRGKVYSEDMQMAYGMHGTVRSYFKSGVLAHGDLKEGMIDIGEILNQDIEKAQDEKAEDKSLKDLKPVHRVGLYLVRHKGKNVGVFRLPSFSPGAAADMKNEYLWLAHGLKRLEKLSDVLVLDTLSNSGGSVYYAARLLSLLATKDRPMKTLFANHKLNETYIAALKPSYSTDTVYNAPSVHADLKLYERYYDELKIKFAGGDQWSGMMPGLELQTESLSDEAGEVFAAKEGVYTKDILLITDKMSASMGDVFAAVLQNNKRATIYGETSCGLGGTVYRRTESLPGSQMSMRCTTSYQELPDGWPLENIGTVPDVYRDIRFSDLKDKFKSYAEGVLDKAVEFAGVPAVAKVAGLEATPLPGSAKAQVVEHLAAMTLETKYVEAAGEITKLLPEMAKDQWKSLIVPLPKNLLEDIVLRTLWERLEVVYRLREMRTLALWSKSVPLIDAALALAEALPEEARFADPCELRLRMTPLKKKPTPN